MRPIMNCIIWRQELVRVVGRLDRDEDGDGRTTQWSWCVIVVVKKVSLSPHPVPACHHVSRPCPSILDTVVLRAKESWFILGIISFHIASVSLLKKSCGFDGTNRGSEFHLTILVATCCDDELVLRCSQI
jgi:hypothetical protein